MGWKMTFIKTYVQIMESILFITTTRNRFGVSYCVQVTLQYLGVPEVHFILLNHLPADHASMIHHNIKVSPRAKFSFPVCYSGKRSNDQKRPSYTSQEDFIEECNRLYGFAKTHFIC